MDIDLQQLLRQWQISKTDQDGYVFLSALLRSGREFDFDTFDLRLTLRVFDRKLKQFPYLAKYSNVRIFSIPVDEIKEQIRSEVEAFATQPLAAFCADRHIQFDAGLAEHDPGARLPRRWNKILGDETYSLAAAYYPAHTDDAKVSIVCVLQNEIDESELASRIRFRDGEIDTSALAEFFTSSTEIKFSLNILTGRITAIDSYSMDGSTNLADYQPNVLFETNSVATSANFPIFNEIVDHYFEQIPEVTYRCEDFPACGHTGDSGPCPPMLGGRQLAMVCTCGTLVPVTSSSSLCARCLRGGGRDAYGEPYEQYGDYDDFDDGDGDEDEDGDEDDDDDESDDEDEASDD